VKYAPKVLLCSIALITLSWITDIAILGIVGGLLLIPVGIVVVGAFLWQVTR